MVDEFQDTNEIQFELIKFLTKDTNHLTVVGDPDQTIYS
ncbi:UvrD-helicase domain-containing protein [Vibrio harveyi]|nr:UvrD-helicase domain-containing protein [Vibrio harveyi]